MHACISETFGWYRSRIETRLGGAICAFLALTTWSAGEPNAHSAEALAIEFDRYEDGLSKERLLETEQYLRRLSPQDPPAHEANLLALLDGGRLKPSAERMVVGWLRLVGSSNSVATLARLAQSRTPTASSAISVLANIGGDVAEAALIRLSELPSPIQVTAVNALGQRQAAGSVTTLALAATTGDPAVIDAAIAALVAVSTPEAWSAVDRLFSHNPLSETIQRAQLAVTEGRLREGPSGVSVESTNSITAILKSSAPAPVRLHAAEVLWRIDKQGMGKTSRELLHTTEPALGRGLAALIVREGTTEDRIDLNAAFPQLSVQVQHAIAITVAALAHADGLPLARTAALSADESVRQAGILAIGRCGDQPEVDTLVALLASDLTVAREALALMPVGKCDVRIRERLQSASSVPERARLLAVLADRQDRQIWPEAMAACRASEDELRGAGYDAVSRLVRAGDFTQMLTQPRPPPAALRNAWRNAVMIAAALEPRPAELVAVVRQQLDQSDADRALLVGALASREGPETKAELEALLGSPDATVRRETIRILAAQASARSAALLLEFVKGATDPEDRVMALRGFVHATRVSRSARPPAPVAVVLEGYRRAWSQAVRPEDKALILAFAREVNGRPGEAFLRELSQQP